MTAENAPSAEPNAPSGPSTLAGWLGDRVGWRGIREALASRSMPRLGVAHYFGGITLFLLILQVASGILLMLYYKPDASQAHASVEQIIGEIPYGKLVRATHVWASDMFVGFLIAHMFSIVVRRSYSAPRELSWLSGLVSLFLGVGLAFTGAILPWNQAALADARIGTDLAKYVPLVGEQLRRFMRGGEEVSSATLGHAFGFHVGALPATITLLIALHLLFVARRASKPFDRRDPAVIPLYPDFFVRGAALTTAVLVVLMTLAVFLERPLGEAANLQASSEGGAHPPWYFLPVHQIVRVAPKEMLGMDGARFLVGTLCALGLGLVALPFIDRRGSKITAWLAAAVLLVLLALSTRALD
jgi:quinol-cytochrome oxidoreductase complex cytochrome b subunit